MEKALERTIETLIASGGDKWEYDSNDIQILVQWIENKQKEVNVTLGNVSKCPHCKSDDVSDIEGIMWCSGSDSTY